MRKLLLLILPMSFLFLASCDKIEDLFEGKDKVEACPSANVESIPSAVLQTQTTQFPEAVVENWYDHNGQGFCALFTVDGNRTIAVYSIEGALLSTEVEDADNEDEDEDEDENEDEEEDEDEDECEEEEEEEEEDGGCDCGFEVD